MTIAGLARCVDQVPAAVPARLHLCYRDYRHQHFKQPESLALQVRVLDAVIAAAGRPVSFVSFTVPQYQCEESYFAPLAELAADPGTELNFALVPYHPADQAPGTTVDQVRLIDAALAASPGGSRAWGICTECGLGRVDREDIPVLLDLHRQIVAANWAIMRARAGARNYGPVHCWTSRTRSARRWGASAPGAGNRVLNNYETERPVSKIACQRKGVADPIRLPSGIMLLAGRPGPHDGAAVTGRTLRYHVPSQAARTIAGLRLRDSLQSPPHRHASRGIGNICR